MTAGAVDCAAEDWVLEFVTMYAPDRVKTWPAEYPAAAAYV